MSSGLRALFKAERQFWRRDIIRVAGADAVGLGSLCGPVVAAAVILPPECRRIREVADSKVVAPELRERLYPRILRQAVAVGVGAASHREVERLNVRTAEILAYRRAAARLGGYDHILIDGNDSRHIDFGPHTAIVDGDATSYTIACASIIAKVTRDRLMRRLAAKYPGYGWETNVGYNTPTHRAALRTVGITPLHRRTFITVMAASQLELAL